MKLKRIYRSRKTYEAITVLLEQGSSDDGGGGAHDEKARLSDQKSTAATAELSRRKKYKMQRRKPSQPPSPASALKPPKEEKAARLSVCLRSRKDTGIKIIFEASLPYSPRYLCFFSHLLSGSTCRLAASPEKLEATICSGSDSGSPCIASPYSATTAAAAAADNAPQKEDRTLAIICPMCWGICWENISVSTKACLQLLRKNRTSKRALFALWA